MHALYDRMPRCVHPLSLCVCATPCSTEELRKLVDDDAAFVTFFNDLPLIGELDALETSLRDENMRLAQDNLLQREPLDKLKATLLEQHEILQVQKHEYDEKQKRLQELVAQCSRDKIIERLEAAKSAADKESRDLQRTFRSNGCTDLKTFVREYQALRERYHSLKIKLDKVRDTP
eukprot:m.74627 g.74627  ORF g.74627 m.74627 type:complete len:176 (+) comp8929_c0_seq1:268-795(+)